MGPQVAVAESRRFGKYTLVAKLAQGGMAEIFLARLGGAAGFEKLVCIKRILPELAENEAFVTMFLDEAKIAARISHPNVCQVYELGTLEGQYYIAMEYLEGVPVSVFRRAKLYPPPPDPRLVAGITVQACEGLHHAHQLKGTDGQMLGVVHRDISPGNLFVTADGIVKVLDFGIAKMQNAGHKTTTGAVKGTYAFMPPEQLRGEGVDRRSDVFALGAVVWELLARRPLFRRETDFLTFQAITTDPIPHVCEFRPDVPSEIGAVILKALSRNRADRYPTARVFGEELVKAVLPLGGPLAASALGEEVSTVFHDKIEEQRQMLEIAREGGQFDLEHENAEAFGMIDNPVTPTSALKRRSEAMRAPTPPPSVTMDVVLPRRTSQPMQAVHPPMPELKSSRAWLVILLVLLAAGGGGGGVYYFLVYKKQHAEPSAHVATPDSAVVAMAHDAAIEIDAREPTIVLDAAVATTPLEDAGIDEPPSDAAVAVRPPKPTDKNNKKKPPPKDKEPKEKPVAGPPGSITIDSTPVYAVIYIDGKKIGETPLIDIKLAPGKHSVKAVSPTGGTKMLSITIEPGKKARGKRIEW